jgi:hypothetical protein
VLGRGGGVDITPTLLYAMVTLEVAGHVSMRTGACASAQGCCYGQTHERVHSRRLAASVP